MSGPTCHHPSEEPCSSLNPDDSNPDDQMNKERSPMGLAVDDHSSISEHIPNVGMTFRSEKDAYDFYNSYAGKIGFSIRKCHAKSRADKTLRGKHFVCSNEGQKSTHSTQETKKERTSTRSDCEARVECMEDSFDKWASEVEALLSQSTFTRVQCLKGKKTYLRGNKNTTKNTRKRAGSRRQSENIDVAGPSQLSTVQENNQSNTIADEILPTLTNTMPIEDTSMPFFPFVRGEFTNLLLQGQIGATTLSTARMLDFDEDTGTPRLNGSHRKNCMPIDVVGCGGAIPAVVAKQSRDLRSCRDAGAAMNKYLKPNVIKQHHM